MNWLKNVNVNTTSEHVHTHRKQLHDEKHLMTLKVIRHIQSDHIESLYVKKEFEEK